MEIIYITGSTSSTDFPTTSGAHQATSAGGYDVIIVNLTAVEPWVLQHLSGGKMVMMGDMLLQWMLMGTSTSRDILFQNFTYHSGAKPDNLWWWIHDAFVAKI
jgi:protein-L-isoaspartate O-methyltransferase